jgi:hypothetical protein
MSKSFTHAGVSKLDGQFKVRFCNDALRQKVLIKNGHTDIDIVELKHAMTKEEAVAYLMEIDFATRDGVTNAEVQAAIAAELDKRSETPKVAKATTTKAPKAKKSTPSLDAIKARASVKAKVPAVDAALEDAPF